jgi:hypothetical protein
LRSSVAGDASKTITSSGGLSPLTPGMQSPGIWAPEGAFRLGRNRN